MKGSIKYLTIRSSPLCGMNTSISASKAYIRRMSSRLHCTAPSPVTRTQANERYDPCELYSLLPRYSVVSSALQVSYRAGNGHWLISGINPTLPVPIVSQGPHSPVINAQTKSKQPRRKYPGAEEQSQQVDLLESIRSQQGPSLAVVFPSLSTFVPCQVHRKEPREPQVSSLRLLFGESCEDRNTNNLPNMASKAMWEVDPETRSKVCCS